MSERYRVSVIIPSFNYGRFIGEALESLQAQTLKDWECLVVDDGSTDNTRDVIAQYCRHEARIRYFYQENGGPSKARNTGIRHSNGTYIQFLDADDLLEPNKLRLQANYLDKHTETDLIYGEVRYFPDGDAEQRLFSMWESDAPWMPKVAGTGRTILRALLEDNIMSVHGPLLRRSIIQRAGLMDESLPALEDWEYWLRCALSGMRFDFDDTPEMYALVRSHGTSSSRDNQRTLAAAITIRERLNDLLEDAELQSYNEKRLTGLKLWRDGLSSSLEEIPKVIQPHQPFILVDEDQVSGRLPQEYNFFPFIERDGRYWGRPDDDDTAIQEFERLWSKGARFIVFAYPAFWWLEHYAGFADYLRSRFRSVLATEYLQVYQLPPRTADSDTGADQKLAKRTARRTMKVHWCNCGPRQGNFGDKITPLLLRHFGVSCQWSEPDSAELLGVGSILDNASENFRGIIWTSGLIHENSRKNFKHAKVAAVRGKLTRQRLGSSAEGAILGDAGLLCDQLQTPRKKRYKLGVIPHYMDIGNPVTAALVTSSSEIIYIDICADSTEVMKTVAQCEHILSSSLHGLILADSYGIPNRWIKLNGGQQVVTGGEFKFCDYYSIYGIEDALPLSVRADDDLDSILSRFGPYSRPGIEVIKKMLLDSLMNILTMTEA